jgi:hypothetical protein
MRVADLCNRAEGSYFGRVIASTAMRSRHCLEYIGTSVQFSNVATELSFDSE